MAQDPRKSGQDKDAGANQPPTPGSDTTATPPATPPADNTPANAPAEQPKGSNKPAETVKQENEAKANQKKGESGGGRTIYLDYEFQNNTPDGLIKYGPGEVKNVPSGIADDLERRNAEHRAYREGVHVRDVSSVYSGTISGAGQDSSAVAKE